jgi:hypothetical protein
MEDYLNSYVAGWGFPEKDHAQFKRNVGPWLEQAGWSLYLARVNGLPAAAATLYVHALRQHRGIACPQPAAACQGSMPLGRSDGRP